MDIAGGVVERVCGHRVGVAPRLARLAASRWELVVGKQREHVLSGVSDRERCEVIGRQYRPALLEMRCRFADREPCHNYCDGSQDQTPACTPGGTRSRFIVPDFLSALVANARGALGDWKRSRDDEAVLLLCRLEIAAGRRQGVPEPGETSTGSAHKTVPVQHPIGDADPEPIAGVRHEDGDRLAWCITGRVRDCLSEDALDEISPEHVEPEVAREPGDVDRSEER